MNKTPNDLKILEFKSAEEFENWLSKNYSLDEGIFIRFYKKATGLQTFSYLEALDIALCYGWIDGIIKSYDVKSYLQKFTPRRKRSIWSKININNVERLIKENRMKESGLLEVNRAKADGRWDAAYDSPSNSKIPDDFLIEVKKNKQAFAFFKTLNKQNLYSITFKLQTAQKPETKQKRTVEIIKLLAENKKIH